MRGDLGLATFRLLIRLYPPGFRDRFAPELEAFFLDERTRARREGRWATARLWARTVRDVVTVTVRLRLGGGGGGMIGDLAQGTKGLRRSPGFTLFAVATLAVGVGATTAVFSVLDTVVLRALPYPGATRMMLIGSSLRGQGLESGPGPYSTADFLDLRAAPGPFEAVVASEGRRGVIRGLGDPERLPVAEVGRGFFDFFGARPAVGRLLAPSDDARRVAVLSHGFWEERFGADPAVVGTRLTLDGEAWEVVGVLGDDFLPPEAMSAPDAPLWVPRGMSVEEPDRTSYGLTVAGRLRPGATPAEGRAHVDRLLTERHAAEGGPAFITGAVAVDMRAATVGEIGRTLGLLLGSVALLLVIACVNVAGLLLARGTRRREELAVRSALGAGRGRIVRQLLGESALLGLAGGALGAALALGAVEVFRRTTPGGIPRLGEVTVDLRVLAFTLVVAVGTALLAGLFPALRATAEGVGGPTGSTTRGTPGRREGLARGALVLVETALAVILAVGSGLMVHELVRLSTADPGFRPEGLVSATLQLPRARPDAGYQPLWDGLLEGARALPGVRAAALGSELPFGPAGTIQVMTPEGGVGVEKGVWVPTVAVSGGYFSTLGIHFVAGRGFTDAELRGEGMVAVVNEAFGARYWPGEDPLRGRIRSGAPDLEEDEGTYAVVGVVADVTTRPGRDVDPVMYVPYRGAEAWSAMTAVARTDPGAEEGAAAGLRRVARELAPGRPVRIAVVEALARESLARPRFYTGLLTAFGTLALALAVVGIYGTTSYAARSRTREIGIRIALGADRTRVVRRMTARASVSVVLGVCVGLAAALASSGLLARFLYHVPARDPATYVSVGASVLLVGVVAALVPAARSSRVDPARTLREEG